KYFLGIIIQIISVRAFMFVFDFSFEKIHRRANNIYKALHENELPKISQLQFDYLIVLFLTSVCLSVLMGHVFHKGLRFAKFDRKFSPLRFSNEWHYSIRNELLEQKPTKTSNYLSTDVDILINEAKDGEPFFYTGILSDYHLNNDG